MATIHVKEIFSNMNAAVLAYNEGRIPCTEDDTLLVKIVCSECDGEGKVEYVDNLFYNGDVSSKIKLCENCKGWGFTEQFF